MIWLRRLAIVLGAAAAVAVLAWVGARWNESRVPEAFGALELGEPEYGGGAPAAAHGHGGHLSVARLHGPQGPADVRFRLVAQRAEVRVSSGRTIHALTFNGRLPGPELRVHEGDLVEATLVNRDIRDGVSIHWHGVDLPNAEDGVAGMTQDAVPVGGRFTYRFRAEDAGTYWYHSHQRSSDEVRRGLFGALVVESRDPSPGADVVVAAHTFGGTHALLPSGGELRRRLAPG